MPKKSLEFHIKSGDYFGTLASVISIIEQSVSKNKEQKNILKKLVKDLVYLQNKYKIIKKI